MTETSNTSQARPTRISDVVKLWSERMPDQPALVETGRTWTYQQLASIVTETQNWLGGLGIRPGDRVMIVCENCRSFVAILLALADIDAWPVLANARLSAREIDQIRDHCGARLVIYTTSVSAQAREHAQRRGATVRVVADLGSLGIGPLNEEVDPEPLEPDPGNRVASVIYTSGTTGLAKGVMLTHQNLLFVAAASAKIRALTPADRMYGILPMSHAVEEAIREWLGRNASLMSGGRVRDHYPVISSNMSIPMSGIKYPIANDTTAITVASLRIVSPRGRRDPKSISMTSRLPDRAETMADRNASPQNPQ